MTVLAGGASDATVSSGLALAGAADVAAAPTVVTITVGASTMTLVIIDGVVAYKFGIWLDDELGLSNSILNRLYPGYSPPTSPPMLGTGAGPRVGGMQPADSDNTPYDGPNPDPRPSSRQVRRAVEKASGLSWPLEDDGSNQIGHHIIPRADGGRDHPQNIKPMKKKDHDRHHTENGDRRRWGQIAARKRWGGHIQ